MDDGGSNGSFQKRKIMNIEIAIDMARKMIIQRAILSGIVMAMFIITHHSPFSIILI